MTSTTYRADVDGLRAVAVIAVVLFHAGFGLAGGYVGVDVFFVISGFLITSLITKQQEAGTFNVVDFFVRRVRRIIPAVSVMTLATLLLGGILLAPQAWNDLARASLAQVAMLANVWYWRTINYFNAEAELMPLLHTWSLAVEEQFYLFYPFLLVALGGLSRKMRFAVLLLLAVGSLALAEVFIRSRAAAVYYLLPTRAWELLLGGLVFYLPTLRFGTLWHEFAVASGMSMVLAGTVLYDGETRFPGVPALLPCLGAGLVIHGGGARLTLVGRVLASRPMVTVGLLSYSIYLWHWPLLALARNLLGTQLPMIVGSGLALLSLVIAAASWRWIEEPARRGAAFATPGRAVVLFGVGVAINAAVASVILAGGGWSSRFTEQTLRCFAARRDARFNSEVTVADAEAGRFPTFGVVDGRDTVVVWGDSHAMMLIVGVDAACREAGVRGVQATHSATAPLLDFVVTSRWSLNEDSPRFNRAIVDWIRTQRVKLVVMHGHWENYVQHPGFEEALRRTVDAVSDSGARLAIMLDTATFPMPVPEALAARSIFGLNREDFVVSNEVYQTQNAQVNTIIRRVAAGRAEILDPSILFTNANGDWFSTVDGTPLYRDASHLSTAGGQRLTPLFEDFFGYNDGNTLKHP